MTQQDQFTEFDFDAPADDGIQRPETTPPKEEMVPKSRLDEAIAQRDSSRNDREAIIKSMLGGAGVPEAPAAKTDDDQFDDIAKPVIPDDTDPDVAKLMLPILEANNRAVAQRLSERVSTGVDTRIAPIEERVNYEDMVNNVRSRIEGFDEIRGEIAARFQKMSAEDQARYNNELGLETMALRIIGDRKISIASRSGMAHSSSQRGSGLRPPTPRGPSEADVHNMSEEEFENFLRSKGIQS